LTRVGDVFTAERSADGVHWVLFGTHTVSMPRELFVGLAVTAHNNSGPLATGVFDNVSIVQGTFTDVGGQSVGGGDEGGVGGQSFDVSGSLGDSNGANLGGADQGVNGTPTSGPNGTDNSGASLSLALPGQTKAERFNALSVSGTLNDNGTEANPVFTAGTLASSSITDLGDNTQGAKDRTDALDDLFAGDLFGTL
jgi:hypothetical protein